MLMATTVGEESRAAAGAEPETLMTAQRWCGVCRWAKRWCEAILGLVRAGRPDDGASDTVRNFVAWGPGRGRARPSCWRSARAR